MEIQDIGEDARRQYLDARATHEAWLEAAKKAGEVRGSMFWRRQGISEYLIRSSAGRGGQKSLGVRSPDTEAIYQSFMARRVSADERLKSLAEEMVRQQRMNRALFVGRAPQLLVDILQSFAESGMDEHFTVIGTHALYAYEAAAGIRFEADALATRDVDLLWDTRKRLRFLTRMSILETSMLGLLQRVDKSFALHPEQKYTAINAKGFQVDIIRRESAGRDPHPLRLTEHEEELYAIEARRAEVLLNAPRFTALIVSVSGHMARMQTISPVAFAEFKRWMSIQPERDAMKRSRDALQARLVEQVVAEYLPQIRE